MNDCFDLERFVAAQDPVYGQVIAELAAGSKASHWMWFVFPQLTGLGRSTTARHFGLASLAEARAYWRHPVLGPRLRACCELVERVPSGSPSRIFGHPDDLKFRSCMTLFERAAPGERLFARLLDQLCGGERDAATLALLEAQAPASA